MKEATPEFYKKLMERLWRLEVQLPGGWFFYNQYLLREQKKWPVQRESIYPIIPTPKGVAQDEGLDESIITAKKGTVRSKGKKQVVSPDLDAAVASEREKINKIVRDVRCYDAMVAIRDSGLSRDDVLQVRGQLEFLIGDVKKGNPLCLMHLSEELLQRILTVPIMIRIQEPELSLFAENRPPLIVCERFGEDAFDVRKLLRELAQQCIQRCMKLLDGPESKACVLWMELLAHMGSGEGVCAPAYPSEQARRIVTTLSAAMALQWAESKLWAKKGAALPSEVVPHYYDVVKEYKPNKKIVLRNGFKLTNKDSDNADLWHGIHTLLTEADEDGYVELPLNWRRQNMRWGRNRSAGAGHVALFLRHVVAQKRGRGGNHRYRIEL